MCYIDHLLRHDFQGQTHLIFGKKRKWEKTGKKKGEETKRQNRRSDDNQRTGVPKTPEEGEKRGLRLCKTSLASFPVLSKGIFDLKKKEPQSGPKKKKTREKNLNKNNIFF